MFLCFQNIFASVEEYQKVLKKQRESFCPKQKEFDQLYQSYRKRPYYIPIFEHKLVKRGIEESLSLLKSQLVWIQNQEKNLKSYLNVSVLDELSKMETSLEKLLSFKEKFYIESKDRDKKDVLIANGQELHRLLYYYRRFLQHRPFLTHANFPIDHEANRIYYEALKDKNPYEAKIFFTKRKIWERGAPKGEHSSDTNIRSLIDTVFIRLEQIARDPELLPNSLRVDLLRVLKHFNQYKTLSLKKESNTLTAWQREIEEQTKLYQSLLSQSDDKQLLLAHEIDTESLALENFVLEQQKLNYLFWKKYPSLIPYFVLDNILLHEVGGLDPTGVEKKMILDVFFNRLKDPSFNQLKKDQKLKAQLGSQGNNVWLNTFFSYGEFSFTLWYFKANAQIYCPLEDPLTQKLREKNLDLIDQYLKEKKPPKHKSLRYYSRISMLGRISMDKSWGEFYPIETRIGSKLILDQSFLRQYSQGQVSFFDALQVEDILWLFASFKGEDRALKLVKGKPVELYEYRDPDLFQYFEKKPVLK